MWNSSGGFAAPDTAATGWAKVKLLAAVGDGVPEPVPALEQEL